MKTTCNRRAISQSLDLFIIIGAVLAVGGVVASAATGLVGSAAATPSLQLVSYSLTGTPSGTLNGGSTLSVTLKNVGTSTILVGPSFSIALTTNSLAGASGNLTCNIGTPTSFAGSTSVTYAPSLNGACTPGNLKGLMWTGPGPAVSLTPGQQLTFAAMSSLGGVTGGATTNLITTGSSYQLTVLANGQSIIQNIVSQ